MKSFPLLLIVSSQCRLEYKEVVFVGDTFLRNILCSRFVFKKIKELGSHAFCQNG